MVLVNFNNLSLAVFTVPEFCRLDMQTLHSEIIVICYICVFQVVEMTCTGKHSRLIRTFFPGLQAEFWKEFALAWWTGLWVNISQIKFFVRKIKIILVFFFVFFFILCFEIHFLLSLTLSAIQMGSYPILARLRITSMLLTFTHDARGELAGYLKT